MHKQHGTDDLRLRRVLVVEDEYLIAQGLADGLRQRGAIVIGPVPDLASAFPLIDAEPLDAAILDINLCDGPVYPLAEKLRDAGTPLGFLTGYDAAAIPERYRAYAHWQKPCTIETLVTALRVLIQS